MIFHDQIWCKIQNWNERNKGLNHNLKCWPRIGTKFGIEVRKRKTKRFHWPARIIIISNALESEQLNNTRDNAHIMSVTKYYTYIKCNKVINFVEHWTWFFLFSCFVRNHRMKRTKSENQNEFVRWQTHLTSSLCFLFVYYCLVFFESEESTQRTRAQPVSCTLNGLSLGHPCTMLFTNTYKSRSGRPMKFNSFSLDIFSVRPRRKCARCRSFRWKLFCCLAIKSGLIGLCSV